MTTIAELKKTLEAAKAAELERLKPLVEKREALLAQLQPLELELREVNKQITAMEREKLVDVGAQLAQLARLTGAKVLKNTPRVAPKAK